MIIILMLACLQAKQCPCWFIILGKVVLSPNYTVLASIVFKSLCTKNKRYIMGSM